MARMVREAQRAQEVVNDPVLTKAIQEITVKRELIETALSRVNSASLGRNIFDAYADSDVHRIAAVDPAFVQAGIDWSTGPGADYLVHMASNSSLSLVDLERARDQAGSLSEYLQSVRQSGVSDALKLFRTSFIPDESGIRTVIDEVGYSDDSSETSALDEISDEIEAEDDHEKSGAFQTIRDWVEQRFSISRKDARRVAAFLVTWAPVAIYVALAEIAPDETARLLEAWGVYAMSSSASKRFRDGNASNEPQ